MNDNINMYSRKKGSVDHRS